VSRHPIQPIEDVGGVLRFKSNTIVAYLLDNGGIDMNALARLEFSDEDWEQFAQLIGYSLSGFGELSYVSSDTYDAAAHMAEAGSTEEQARIASLEYTLRCARESVRSAAVALFHIAPEDLQP
jgi:hypothetical protein